MNSNLKLANLQQSIVHKYTQNSSPYTFFNQLTAPLLLEIVEDLLPEHRERSFPPTETLSIFLAQVMHTDRSCQNIINEVAFTRSYSGMIPCSSNTGSYCKARQRLTLKMISELTRYTGQSMAFNVPKSWCWNGRPVRLIDGTTVELPDTPDNRQAYPQTRSGKGCPLARLVGVFCLASGGLLNAAIGAVSGKKTGEQKLLRSMLDSFESGDVVLGDAFYGSYWLLAEMITRGVDVVFEQHGGRKKTTDFRRGKALGKKDHLMTYIKPRIKPAWISQEKYDSFPNTLTIRELKVGHKILITTMLSASNAPKTELKEFYQQRWHVELDFRNLKTTLGMGLLSCKTPDMIIKEIWVYLLAYNLIRIAMAEAAKLSDVLPRQLSFKHSLQLWRAWRQYSNGFNDDDSLSLLFSLIVEKTVGNRSGRVEPRVVKRWRKTYPIMVKPRGEMRLDIRRHGHPPKPRGQSRPAKIENAIA